MVSSENRLCIPHTAVQQLPTGMITPIRCRKVLKQIFVGELQPDDTVDAVREARLLAKVTLVEADTAAQVSGSCRNA